MKEDIYVCEQLQKSLTSPYFEFGPSASQGELPIREFQKMRFAAVKRIREVGRKLFKSAFP